MTRDLHAEKDGLWSFPYVPPAEATPIALGELGVHGDGSDLAILTYGNGTFLSRQAAKALEEKHGIGLRVVDLRWLAPLDEAKILTALEGCARVLIVDECRVTGSQSEALVCLITEKAEPAPKLRRLAAEDSFISLGPAATATLPRKESIVEAALALLQAGGWAAPKALPG